MTESGGENAETWRGKCRYLGNFSKRCSVEKIARFRVASVLSLPEAFSGFCGAILGQGKTPTEVGAVKSLLRDI